jgi:hypothetical protein
MVTDSNVVTRSSPRHQCNLSTLPITKNVCKRTQHNADLSYEYLSVSLAEMIKAFTPTLVLIFYLAIGREAMSCMRMLNILLLSAGIAIASTGDITFVPIGVMMASMATVSAACKLVFLEGALKGGDAVPASLAVFYLMPVQAVSGVPAFLFFEARQLAASRFAANPAEATHTLLLMLVGAFMAFILTLSELLAIHHTSALSLTVIAVGRFIITIVVAAFLFHVPLTVNKIVGL